ncbi:MAG: AEC family transporter [Tissierellia bacterium]|nr:AEC family transporter [Tissierellia bacterium]
MIEILSNQLIIFAIIMFFGLIATKKNMISDDTSKEMSNVILNIANPALILSSYNVEATDDIINNLILTGFYSTIVIIIGIIFAVVFTSKLEGDRKKVLRFAAVIGNSGYMGFPLVAAVFGSTGLLYASIFAITYNIATWTFGDMVMSGLKMEDKKSLVKKLVSNPSLIAVFIGLVLFLLGVKFPYVVSEPLRLLGSLTGPLSMLLLGEKMSKIDFKKALKDKHIYYGIFLRLILIPIVTLFILKVFKAPVDILNVIFVVMAMPAAIMTVILSDKYNRDVEFSSQLTVITHAICIVTIPLLFRLV